MTNSISTLRHYDLESQSLSSSEPLNQGNERSIPLGDSDHSIGSQVASLASQLITDPRQNAEGLTDAVSTWATKGEPLAKNLQRFLIPALSVSANAFASAGQYGGLSALSLGAATTLNAAYLIRARTQFVMQGALKHWQGETHDMSSTDKITYFARIVREIGAANSLFLLSLEQTDSVRTLNGVIIAAALISALAEEGTNTVKNLHQRPDLLNAAKDQRELLIQNLVQAAIQGSHQDSLNSETIKRQIAETVEQYYPINEDFSQHNKCLKTALLTTFSLMVGTGITGIAGLIADNQNAKSIGTLSTGAIFQTLAFVRPLLTRESQALQQEGNDLTALNTKIADVEAVAVDGSFDDQWLDLLDTIRADIAESQQLSEPTLGLLKKNVEQLHQRVIEQLQPKQSLAQNIKQLGTQVRLGPGVDSVFLSNVDQRVTASYVVSIFSKAALAWTSTGDPLVDAKIHDEKLKTILGE